MAKQTSPAAGQGKKTFGGAVVPGQGSKKNSSSQSSGPPQKGKNVPPAK